MQTTHLGGRIPLFDPAGLTDEQRPVYDRLSRTVIQWADASGFRSTEGDRLIGPFNPVLLSPGITQAFLDLQDAEQANSSLDDRVRQVVILTVGAVWRSDYEVYAHAAVARRAGLPEGTINALVSGAVPDGLSEPEHLAARVTRALSTGHRIEAALYHDALAAFGTRGLVDLVYLAGCYHIVCGLLNAFEIPAPVEQTRSEPGRTKQAALADCFAGLIWRVDVQPGGRDIQARVWLAHDTMGYFPGKLKPEQPGVNGVRYAARTNHLYDTATARKLLMRVPVDPATLEPAGAPELVVAGRMGDDFCIDEDAGVIYLATHRQNSIDRISMDPGDNSGFPESVVADPFTESLIGPCSVAWGRAPGDYGRVAYVISDGGTASPSPGGPLPARLQLVEF